MDLLEFVSGLDFPISREDLVRQAQERGAGNDRDVEVVAG